MKENVKHHINNYVSITYWNNSLDIFRSSSNFIKIYFTYFFLCFKYGHHKILNHICSSHYIFVEQWEPLRSRIVYKDMFLLTLYHWVHQSILKIYVDIFALKGSNCVTIIFSVSGSQFSTQLLACIPLLYYEIQ